MKITSRELNIAGQPDVAATTDPSNASLMDFAVIVVKRKYVVLIVSILVGSVPLAYLEMKPAVYHFRTAFQMARTPQGPVEPVDVVMPKLRETYIPLVVNNMDGQEASRPLEVQVENPGGGDLLVLASTGRLSDKPFVQALYDSIVAELARDHNKMLERARASTDAALEQVESRLKRLTDEGEYLRAQLARVSESERNIGAELLLERRNAEKFRGAHSEPTEPSNTQERANAMLFAAIGEQQHQERILHYEDRLNVTLARQRDTIQQAQMRNWREQEDSKDDLRKIQAGVSEVRPTAMMTSALMAKKKPDSGKWASMTVGLFFGLAFGIFCAYFLEFFAKVRAQTRVHANP